MTHAECSWTRVHEIEKHIPFPALALMSSYVSIVKLYVCILKNSHSEITLEVKKKTRILLVTSFHDVFKRYFAQKKTAAAKTVKQYSFHAT